MATVGDANAMYWLGTLYDVPARSGLTVNLVAAREWYEKAARSGHAGAEFALANMLEYGEGGPTDLVAARRHYRSAAEHHFPSTAMNYARMLERGRGGEESPAEAAHWYQVAVDSGDFLSATNLASMHFSGRIADASDEVAFGLFNRAAEHLDGLAHCYLGEMYLRGRGTDHGAAEALLHFCIAAILLPDGTNRSMAMSRKSDILQQVPAAQAQFEERAADYIRIGTDRRKPVAAH